MGYLFLVGRLLVGGYFIRAGFNHFKNGAAMAGYAKSKGVPMAKAGVYLSGILLFLGGLGVLLGFQVVLAVIMLEVALLPITFMMHNFWSATDPMAKMTEQVQFAKNVALIGFTLILLAVPTPWFFSL